MSRLDNEAVSDGDEYGVGMKVYEDRFSHSCMFGILRLICGASLRSTVACSIWSIY